VFGSLRMLGVTFDDAIVLLDATEGNLDGPFDLDSPLDATALLAQHAAYATGTTVKYFSFGDCPHINAGSWHPGGVPAVVPAPTPRLPSTFPSQPNRCPPPGSTPPNPPPATAWPNRIPCYNPANPAGGWAGCTCSGTSGTFYCIVSKQFVGGTPPRVYQRVTYYNCGAGPTAPAGCPPAGCVIVKQETWY
jgi:hypothetical protein